MNATSFLKTQHDDLITAEQSLIQVIEDLDTGMRIQFEEKFKEIKTEFNKVFQELFGGGRGTIELVEGEDILEAGIVIISQPPGKKITEYDAAFRWRKSTDGNFTAVCHSEFKTVTVLSA